MATQTEVLEFKKIKVLGYTTDFNQCDCCGRENLKGTISILDENSGVVLHFGTGCAASADKYDTLDAVKEVKRDINRAVSSYNEKEKFCAAYAMKLLKMNSVENVTKSMFQQLKHAILNIRLSGNTQVILLEGQSIPKHFRSDLEECGMCLRLPIPQ